MPTFNWCAGLSFIVSLATGGSAESVTLWQFGQGRLLSADVTLPLEPLGTALDGSATTYLYRALNNDRVTATEADGALVIQTTAIPTPRTIVASASGWVEPFGPTDSIACRLINSEFGACTIGTSTANTGKPTPEVLQVAPTAPFPTIASIPSTSAPSSSKSPAQDQGSSPPVGAIVGGTVGAVAVLLLAGVTLFIFYRKRRLREITHDSVSTSAVPFNAAPQLEAALIADTTSGHQKDRAVCPQDVVRVGLDPPREKDTTLVPDAPTASAVDADSLQRRIGEIVERLRILEMKSSVRHEEPPPDYR